MPTQKHYAGPKLRDIRTKAGLTQKDFASRLGVSLPYLNQMENNNRPVSAVVIAALTDQFGMDPTALETGDAVRLVSDMREVLADPVFAGETPQIADLRQAANATPALLHAFLGLHAAYQQTHERLASLDEALGRDGARLTPSPWDDVRDFFHYCDNYVDAVDRAAERFATQVPQGQSIAMAAQAALENAGITLSLASSAATRSYDPIRKHLTLSSSTSPVTQQFQLILQMALITQERLIEATLDLARFRTDEARAIAKIGLANYFAGAVIMPYKRFHAAAQAERHDLERLAVQFDASLEQVSHRLSTLQRPGLKGLPFFFVRVDPAGTITKRHSATPLQFARFGGACPLWNVHQAFETPGRWLRQLAQTPDGVRYFCLARDVSKSGGAWGAPIRRYAIGLGCEIKHAGAVVYADGLEATRAEAFEPIGISCRICERRDCHQRAVPPLERQVDVNPDYRGVLPYKVR